MNLETVDVKVVGEVSFERLSDTGPTVELFLSARHSC